MLPTHLVATALQEHDGVGGGRLVGLEGLGQALPVLGEEGEGDAERVVPHGEVAVSRVGEVPCASHLRRLDVSGEVGGAAMWRQICLSYLSLLTLSQAPTHFTYLSVHVDGIKIEYSSSKNGTF